MGRWTPDGFRNPGPPRNAANSNLSGRARVLLAAKLALGIARRVHPVLRYIDLLILIYEYLQRQGEGQVAYAPAGFHKAHTCPPDAVTGGPGARAVHNIAAPLVCFFNQALTAGDVWAPFTVSEKNNGFSIFGDVASPPALVPMTRWNTLEIWKPDFTMVQADSPATWIPAPRLVPDWLVPNPLPLEWQAPQPVAPPLPIVRARPVTKPNAQPEQSHRGDSVPEVGTLTLPDLPLIPYVVPPGGGKRWKPIDYKPPKKRQAKEKKSPLEEWPMTDRTRFPAWRPDLRSSIKAVPGQVQITSEGTSITPSTHRRRARKKNEKERKIVVSASKLAIGRAAGTVTEGVDALDAIYEALPKAMRDKARASRHGKDPRVTVKLRMVYDHFDQVDLRQAVRNLLENQVEDWFYGQLGQRAQEGLNRSGWKKATGIEHGNALGKTPEGFEGARNPLSDVLEKLSDLVVPNF